MPIVDGLAATRKIRALEKERPRSSLSRRTDGYGRLPIFAVSASLVEHERESYMRAGFDGWILKPIDFRRLNTLLAGIVEDATREESRYRPGKWEQGGWFRAHPQLTLGGVEMKDPFAHAAPAKVKQAD